jgi:hypothetical protein
MQKMVSFRAWFFNENAPKWDKLRNLYNETLKRLKGFIKFADVKSATSYLCGGNNPSSY